MAKSVSQKVQKRIRRSAKSIEKSIAGLKSGNGPSAATVAGLASVAVAGAAAVAVAVHYRRREPEGAVKMHVVRADGRWAVMHDGAEESVETFATKKEAVSAGRSAAAEAAPSDLVIHRADGSVQGSHSYAKADTP